MCSSSPLGVFEPVLCVPAPPGVFLPVPFLVNIQYSTVQYLFGALVVVVKCDTALRPTRYLPIRQAPRDNGPYPASEPGFVCSLGA